MGFVFRIGRASGRGECRYCNEKIAKDTLHIQIFDCKFGKLYHIPCVLENIHSACQNFEEQEKKAKIIVTNEKQKHILY
jgi:hypothetical protein